MALSPDIASFDHRSREEGLLLREFSHRINNEFASAIGTIAVAAKRSGNREVKSTLRVRASDSRRGADDRRRSGSDFHLRHSAQKVSRLASWRKRSQNWRRLMIAAQGGESQAYEQLLREVDAWLRRYYARRLPSAAAEDARQDALLAIHSKRHSYVSSKPFGPWVAAIARYKWIDQLRDAARFVALPLDDDMPNEDESTISALVVDGLLKQLKPAQARVIRLVKLQDASIEAASRATGQSAALVKVNLHRGLKKLAALAADDANTHAGVRLLTQSSV
jgi:RNA polymerase sigma factor (sigma-70 family)